MLPKHRQHLSDSARQAYDAATHSCTFDRPIEFGLAALPPNMRGRTRVADLQANRYRVTAIITAVTRCDRSATLWKRGESAIVTGAEFIFLSMTRAELGIHSSLG